MTFAEILEEVDTTGQSNVPKKNNVPKKPDVPKKSSVEQPKVPKKHSAEHGAFETIETTTLWTEADIRNSMLKSFALMAGAAGCAYFELMHRILYIPIIIGCLMALSFKFGEYRGRNK